MNNLSNERITDLIARIKMFGHGAGYSADEVLSVLSELLAYREAAKSEPVAPDEVCNEVYGMTISADEFVKMYCKNGDITEREFYESQIPMPDATSPNGWAAVSNNPLAIKAHVELYMSQVTRQFESLSNQRGR